MVSYPFVENPELINVPLSRAARTRWVREIMVTSVLYWQNTRIRTVFRLEVAEERVDLDQVSRGMEVQVSRGMEVQASKRTICT